MASSTGTTNPYAPGQPGRDIRLVGFSDRASLAAAWAWLDGRPAVLAPHAVAVAEASGRVLAEPVASPADLPDADRAASDGHAVRAADCDGASAYNPLTLAWLRPGAGRLPPGSACPVAAGWTLPEGTDAVLPFGAAQPSGGRWLEVLAPVAPGTGIDRRGQGLRAGAVLMERGRRLRPQDLACLAALGVASVSVLRRPQVRVVVTGAKSGPDALTPMLRALLTRDGADAGVALLGEADETSLVRALTGQGNGEADLVLVAGRSGAGPDDVAAPAVQAAGGALALHGLALHPGGSAGLGTLPGGLPVLLLPGEPSACLAAYDMLAARLVRRLAGGGVSLPYPATDFALERKIASGIGLVEIVPVRLAGGRAHPAGVGSGLAGAVRADGFVVVPEASEGYPAGATVRVHLYGGSQP